MAPAPTDQAPANRWLKRLFFALIVKPVVLIVLGLNVRGRERIPLRGPAIIAANHNSHLDTLVLMSLLPLRALPKVRPVAAADYFLSKPRLAWFTLNVLGIIPIERKGGRRGEGSPDVLADCVAALEQGQILILFPEGTRGEPEEMGEFKAGIARLAARVPQTKIVPVFMHGLGKVLPKGSWLPVPFFCDIFVAEPQRLSTSRAALMEDLRASFDGLRMQGRFPEWR